MRQNRITIDYITYFNSDQFYQFDKMKEKNKLNLTLVRLKNHKSENSFPFIKSVYDPNVSK